MLIGVFHRRFLDLLWNCPCIRFPTKKPLFPPSIPPSPGQEPSSSVGFLPLKTQSSYCSISQERMKLNGDGDGVLGTDLLR